MRAVNEPVSNKRYKLACVPIKDSDQPAHPYSLIRVYNRHPMGSQRSNVSSDEELRLWSDCVKVLTDLNLHCMHMPTCILCWSPAQLDVILRVLNQKLIFVFLKQNICSGYSKEPSQ